MGRRTQASILPLSVTGESTVQATADAVKDQFGLLNLLVNVWHTFYSQLQNDASWNSIIAAYGSHGALIECLGLFYKMVDNSIWPDRVIFLAIISACGLAGEIDEGINYFYSMTNGYGIPGKIEHYACMADLFGGAGRVKEAFEMIKTMPFPPDAGVWGTLLGASWLHGHVELASIGSQQWSLKILEQLKRSMGSAGLKWIGLPICLLQLIEIIRNLTKYVPSLSFSSKN
ncbi:hypothetical protein MLD38_039256 [Melastoma candidum]|uniref:Uncharacterized protein n=1 Tax=Melastoma candidum TaxID=119954 RepID=A0ACB9L2A6_9MYRT|nr:hypothetical protein MLD38_039256 [Melastoma candidum]